MFAAAADPDDPPPTPPPSEGAVESGRPTAIPAFDVERFARERAKSSPPQVPTSSVDEKDMLELLALGDAEAAFNACERRLTERPSDPIALHYQPLIRAELEAGCGKALGSLLQIPRVAVALKDLAQFPLDHRTAFVFSLVDGVSNFDTVLAISGMPRFDALRALSTLLRLRVIATS